MRANVLSLAAGIAKATSDPNYGVTDRPYHHVKACRSLPLEAVGEPGFGIDNLLARAKPLLDHADDGRDVFESAVVGVIAGPF